MFKVGDIVKILDVVNNNGTFEDIKSVIDDTMEE